MKMTLTTYDIANALMQDSNANWSHSGAVALAEYLEEMEQSTGEDMELDVVAIRCDFSEYSSIIEWANEYHGENWKEESGIDEDTDEDEIDDILKSHIKEHGQIIEFNGGIIVSNF
jgi:hypothetical protein